VDTAPTRSASPCPVPLETPADDLGDAAAIQSTIRSTIQSTALLLNKTKQSTKRPTLWATTQVRLLIETDEEIQEIVDIGLESMPTYPEIDELNVKVTEFNGQAQNMYGYTLFDAARPFTENRLAGVSLNSTKPINAYLIFHELGHVHDYYRACYDPMETARRFVVSMYLLGEVYDAYIVGSLARGKMQPHDIDMVLFNKSQHLPERLARFAVADRKAPWSMSIPKERHSWGAFDIHIAAFGALMPGFSTVRMPPTLVLDKEQSASFFAEQVCREHGYEDDIYPIEQILSGARMDCRQRLGLPL